MLFTPNRSLTNLPPWWRRRREDSSIF